jgi:hypothetical protein
MGFFDLEGLDGQAVDTVSEVLQGIWADVGRCDRAAISPQEIVRGLIESTQSRPGRTR